MSTPMIPTARNPFEVVMLIGLIAVGAPYLFGIATSQAMEKMLPHTGAVWGGLVVVSCLVSLVGMMKRNGTGIIIEQVGLMGVGLCALFYALVVLMANLHHPAPAVVSIGLGASYGISCLWRFVQLQRDIRRAAAATPRGAVQ